MYLSCLFLARGWGCRWWPEPFLWEERVRGAEVTKRRHQPVGGRGREWEWARLAHLAVLRRVEGGGGINAQGMDGLTGGLTDGQDLWPKARHQLWTWA